MDTGTSMYGSLERKRGSDEEDVMKLKVLKKQQIS